MTPPAELVSVVLLNWNSGALGAEAAVSVDAQDWPAIELVVVDNASTDDSLDRILETTTPNRIVCHETNRGFAAGMNAGIAVAAGAYVLPLNCDATLEPDYVAILARALADHPRVAAVGGRVSSPRVGDTGPLEITTLMRTRNLPVDNPTACDKVNGACPLFRMAALRQVIDRFGGPYDESYGTYGEDIDLARTLGRLGWRYLYEPSARARHVRSYASAPRVADKRGELRISLLANRHRNIVRHGGRATLGAEVAACAQDAGFAALRLGRGDTAAPRDVARAWRRALGHVAQDRRRRRQLAPLGWYEGPGS